MLDELRDELAIALGWHHPNEPDPEAPNGFGEWWHEDHPPQNEHPVPDGDLTALAAAWPEGYYLSVEVWQDGKAMASGGRDESDTVCVGVFNTRYEAEARLTLAVLQASKGDG